MLKWFRDCKSIEDVKRTYRELCKQYHPDLNKVDTTETMKQINAEYETAFNRFKNVHESAEDNTKTYTANTETTETAAEFMEIINKLIVCEGLEINVCAKWLWATGNTYTYKDLLKSLNFRYASKKKAWYWRKDEDACKSRKNMSLEEIKNKYGCETFKGVGAPRLVTA